MGKKDRKSFLLNIKDERKYTKLTALNKAGAITSISVSSLSIIIYIILQSILNTMLLIMPIIMSSVALGFNVIYLVTKGKRFRKVAGITGLITGGGLFLLIRDKQAMQSQERITNLERQLIILEKRLDSVEEAALAKKELKKLDKEKKKAKKENKKNM